jgi:hypothetical protein
MLRVANRHLGRQQRSFVSSVLLTRTWENESVADLKKVAKERGLSPFVEPRSFDSRYNLTRQQTGKETRPL